MSFLDGFKQMKADALRTNAQLPDGHGVGRSPPGQRLQNLARQEHDAQEAAARASAYSYNQYGSNRAPSYRGPAPPKAMQAMMSGMNKELRFEDPQAKALLREIFNIPAFTEQLFSFPVHSRYQRRTYYGQPGMLVGGWSKAMMESMGSGGRIQYSNVFDLPPSSEPERIGFRLYQAIDLYKDAWCFNSEQQSVPVLAGAETECKARVDEWVEWKKEMLKATATAAEMAAASSEVAATAEAATAAAARAAAAMAEALQVEGQAAVAESEAVTVAATAAVAAAAPAVAASRAAVASSVAATAPAAGRAVPADLGALLAARAGKAAPAAPPEAPAAREVRAAAPAALAAAAATAPVEW